MLMKMYLVWLSRDVPIWGNVLKLYTCYISLTFLGSEFEFFVSSCSILKFLFPFVLLTCPVLCIWVHGFPFSLYQSIMLPGVFISIVVIHNFLLLNSLWSISWILPWIASAACFGFVFLVLDIACPIACQVCMYSIYLCTTNSQKFFKVICCILDKRNS